MVRWIAKLLVSRGLCQRVLVQLTYSIGISYMLIHMELEQMEKVIKNYLKLLKKKFDMKLGKIIKELKLTRPIFTKTAKGGHWKKCS